MIRDAKALYTSQDKKNREFKSDLAWEVLRTEPKWIVSPPAPVPVPSSLALTSEASDTSKLEQPPSPVRPVGKKKAKRVRLIEAQHDADHETEAEMRAEEMKINKRRVAAIEESNKLTQDMMTAEVMSKEMEILDRDEIKVKDERTRKTLKRMQDVIHRQYESHPEVKVSDEE